MSVDYIESDIFPNEPQHNNPRLVPWYKSKEYLYIISSKISSASFAT